MIKAKIVITWKSGHTQEFKAKSFTVIRTDGRLTSVEWVDISPKPLYLNVDEVESIIEV